MVWVGARTECPCLGVPSHCPPPWAEWGGCVCVAVLTGVSPWSPTGAMSRDASGQSGEGVCMVILTGVSP